MEPAFSTTAWSVTSGRSSWRSLARKEAVWRQSLRESLPFLGLRVAQLPDVSSKVFLGWSELSSVAGAKCS
eukprot:1722508-Prorocentrum_lima.AAC.1